MVCIHGKPSNKSYDIPRENPADKLQNLEDSYYESIDIKSNSHRIILI